MHLQPVFKDCMRKGGEVAKDLFNRGLRPPSGTAMTEKDLDRVISVIKRCKR
jgi:dTDP-4-amino-4,6-dideoxygalactose transaminase